MASARLYWYPNSSGALATFNFSEGLTDLVELPSADVVDAVTPAGIPQRNHRMGTRRFRVTLERAGTVGADSRQRELATLESFLYRGGFFGFTKDHAKTWASVTVSPPSAGDTTLYTPSGNGFTSWSASGSPETGDEVVIESMHPESNYEEDVAGTIVSTVVLMPIAAPGVIYDYAGPAIVRWKDFYPVCYLPQDQCRKRIVYWDHRRNWTLDAEFEYVPAAVLALYTDGESSYAGYGGGVLGGGVFGMDATTKPALRDSNGSQGFGGLSLQDYLNRSPRLRDGLLLGQ